MTTSKKRTLRAHFLMFSIENIRNLAGSSRIPALNIRPNANYKGNRSNLNYRKPAVNRGFTVVLYADQSAAYDSELKLRIIKQLLTDHSKVSRIYDQRSIGIEDSNREPLRVERKIKVRGMLANT